MLFIICFISLFPLFHFRAIHAQHFLVCRRFKKQIVGTDTPVLRKEVQAKQIFRALEKDKWQRIVGLIIFQFNRVDFTPEGRNLHLHQVILQGDKFFFTHSSLSKCAQTILKS